MSKTHPCSKLAVFIRHGEKTPSNFGPALLTEQARKDIASMAISLKSLGFNIQIYSSPELRCVETAKIFNKVISESKNIILTHFLGDPGVQVKELDFYLELYMEKGARVMYEEWVSGLHWDIIKKPDELVSEFNVFLNKLDHSDDLSLFISQSGTIAALEYALKLRHYDVSKNQWVAFLDGFVFPCER